MDSTVRSRIIKGLGSQAISQPIAFGIQILSVPLFLHFWGIALYGEWLILSAVPTYLMISDLGLTVATTHDMSMRVAHGDRPGALASFQTSWIVVSGLSGLAGLVILGAGIVIPFQSWFGFSHIDQNTVFWILVILTVQMLVTIQQGLLSAGLICAEAFALSNIINSLTRLMGFGMMAAVLAMGYGPIEAAVAMTLGPVTGVSISRFYLLRLCPWLRYGKASANRSTARQLLFPSMGALGFVIGNALTIQGPLIVLGALVDPAAAAIFSTLRMIARAVLTIMSGFFAIIRPEISYASGRQELDKVRRLHTHLLQITFWIAGSAFVALLLLGNWILQLWTGGKIPAVQPAFALILASTFFTVLWTAGLSVLYASNRAQSISVAYVSLALIGLSVGAGLGVQYGINGVAGSLAAADAFLFAFILVRTNIFLGLPAADFAVSILRPPREIIQLLLGRTDR